MYAFDEMTGRGLLQVLRNRDERDLPATEQRADRDVVLQVAREAVDFVDDDRVDV